MAGRWDKALKEEANIRQAETRYEQLQKDLSKYGEDIQYQTQVLNKLEDELARMDNNFVGQYNRIATEKGPEAAEQFKQEREARAEQLESDIAFAKKTINNLQSGQSSAQRESDKLANKYGLGGEGQNQGQNQAQTQDQAQVQGGDQAQVQEGDQAQAQEGDQTQEGDQAQAQAQEGDQAQEGGEGQQEGAKNPQGSGFMKAFGNAVGSYFGNAVSQRVAKSGVDPSGVSASDRRIAELREQNAQNLDKASQQSLQIANRNYRDEAEKNAVAQAAQENQQKVANMGNASAGAAALERGTAQADYDTHMQRSDTQREKGYNYLDAADASRQSAEQARAEAKVKDYRYGDMAQRNRQSDFLSEGPIPEEETPKPDDGSGEGGGELPDDGGGGGQQVDMRNVNVQQVINYLQGRQPAASAEEANAVIQQYIQETGADPSVAESLAQPIPREESLAFGDDYGKLNDKYKERSGGAEFMQWLTSWQNRGDTEEATEEGLEAEVEAAFPGEADLAKVEGTSGGGISDSRIKNVSRGVNVGNIARMLYEMSGPGR